MNDLVFVQPLSRDATLYVCVVGGLDEDAIAIACETMKIVERVMRKAVHREVMPEPDMGFRPGSPHPAGETGQPTPPPAAPGHTEEGANG